MLKPKVLVISGSMGAGIGRFLLAGAVESGDVLAGLRMAFNADAITIAPRTSRARRLDFSLA